MSGLGCCFWWFLFGALLGWLASWLLGRMIGKGSEVATVAAAPVRAPDTVDFAAARAAGFVVSGADNLEIIEGIGPKIAHLLRSNGITSFAKLAGMGVPALRAVLDKGGDRFKINNPQTWAEQAGLAASNRWADLRALQDVLVDGVRRT